MLYPNGYNQMNDEQLEQWHSDRELLEIIKTRRSSDYFRQNDFTAVVTTSKMIFAIIFSPIVLIAVFLITAKALVLLYPGVIVYYEIFVFDVLP